MAMNKIESVTIEQFWGDKTVELKFKDDVNFLIGVNGSGKTTIINLIAATLKADFTTLKRTNFSKIIIELKPQILSSQKKKTAFIEVEKTNDTSTPYYRMNYRIKSYDASTPKKISFDEREEEYLWHYSFPTGREYAEHPQVKSTSIKSALESLVDVSWLTIHRVSAGKRDEKSFDSTIDQKIGELQIDLVKYFSLLNGKYAAETEKFQKYIFESLIEPVTPESVRVFKSLKPEKEREQLREIFTHFQLEDTDAKLGNYFRAYERSATKMNSGATLIDLAYVLGTQRIHSVVTQWNKVIQKQKEIFKSRDTFLTVINSLLQRKQLFINEKNELTVKTQSQKIFKLTTLSSGEKQLLIILGESLLQGENIHIYIADEPELSLHVEWQEQLVSSLKKLNPNSQVIFATHSPDIVGEFQNSVIKIEEAVQ